MCERDVRAVCTRCMPIVPTTAAQRRTNRRRPTDGEIAPERASSTSRESRGRTIRFHCVFPADGGARHRATTTTTTAVDVRASDRRLSLARHGSADETRTRSRSREQTFRAPTAMKPYRRGHGRILRFSAQKSSGHQPKQCFNNGGRLHSEPDRRAPARHLAVAARLTFPFLGRADARRRNAMRRDAIRRDYDATGAAKCDPDRPHDRTLFPHIFQGGGGKICFFRRIIREEK